ncbi:hypothetical protein [Xylocopilactobacillus apis]|uniref:Integral membrane protein n=1 Tax=Xylocopilactobacillus apis TaxID=2932183 RepID=A0AAU9DNV3_9LACO|nr:hypothetical protein [Xylocopilactobacillus apis]BDR56648.1 hypothetical protein KIMC2_12100 [Xylocopilactobacillus apis]
MINKKNLNRYAIFTFILDAVICIYILSAALNFLPAFIMGILYLCVGINDWRFRVPKTYVGPAIDGWLMLFAAVLGFVFVNDAYPDLTVWSWLAVLSMILNIPAMLHPNKKIDFIEKK